MYRIYLVEDEANLNELLTSYLKKEGWHVTSFLTGTEAYEAVKGAEPPHVWILDIMLPDIDGFELLREIKAVNPDLPVIFISARDADLDRILGLELGSDDYLAKPFLPRELVIRTKKLLARVYEKVPSFSQMETEVIQLPPYLIDVQRRMIKEGETVIELTAKEFDLLLVFARHPARAFSREQLLRKVWGDDYFGSDRAVDDLVRRVRKKLPKLRIETIYGFGYRMIGASTSPINNA
ncbi:response regulator transcription factor [Thermaerobacillus caldiproteolyticus]|uniref:Two-component system response regulator CssR n=1 Tax=Thermaerobacillus caldiproteolyticus TaxID=247480 RepID=A0A7V9ZA00_9BACL|nr:response regulator transcription factor [Anoxybacillus caldiproteolyticus]MBA2876616.1 two-component system response regulator CssR [Anoxybacillus caldiproteolyticus]QPA31323.1 response regulator transcription factor [Anoxybacillus caldiproteolyticus]